MTALPAHGTQIAPSLCRVVALSVVCWCWILHRMASDMPDLSHLTPEEREIIESVVHRQKQEEQKEQEIMRRKQEEVILLEEKIRQRSEQQKKAGVELDATCHICLKTKFADGVGHLCNYCGIRCCARCGGKVTLRSSKVIWVCILCRKKQELLSKSGEWINHGMTVGSDPSRRIDGTSPCLMSDKRPKLERAHSAVEKENVPLLQRSNSQLRRQYSQQEPSSRKEQEHSFSGSHDEYFRPSREDYYRGGQLEGMHRNGSNQSSRVHHTPHQFGPADKQMGGRVTGANVPRKHKRLGNTVPAERLHTHQQHISFSSSEEELRSTSECTSCDEHESEKAICRKMGTINCSRRKKTVRFDYRHHQPAPQTSKDSGFDTSSSIFTSNEDPLYFSEAKQPMSWQRSPDNKFLIGHMVLNKSVWETPVSPSSSAAAMLGLKITGGKLLSATGRRCAIIDRVRKGSTADMEGNLKPGDEVLEWNGCLLQGKTHKEVADIIAESKHLPQIELKVSRSILPRRASYGTPPKATSTSTGLYDLRKDKPYVMITSPGSPEHLASHPARILRSSKSVSGPNSLHVGGKIQVKLGFDQQSLKLVVTIMAASNLLSRPDGSPRSAYAKVCLLPDTSEKSKRRTKTIMNSIDPKWNQSFSFTTMRRSDLKFKVLQISLWDYDNNPTNQFLGEVLIELGLKKLDNLAEWYLLTAHQEITGEGGVSIGDYDMDYGEHLSPPSTLSRQSDSDASDVDDCCSGRRVGADGASISSLGSSISPPPDYDHLDRRKSRRDNMSPALQKSYVYGTNTEKKYGYEMGMKQQSISNRSITNISHRSRSAAPTDSPSQHTRSRSKSPTIICDRRSLSPPDYRYPGGVPSYRQGTTRFLARSATTTPTSTPKKRQLPQIPGTMPSSLDERIPYYFDDQTSSMRRRMRQMQPRRMQGRSGGFGRLHHYGGLSDSDIPLQQMRSLTPPHVRGSLMSRGETGDICDIDDSDSVISSALSTQSEQPRSTRFCCCNATDYRYPTVTHSLSCSYSQSSSKRASVFLYRYNSVPVDSFLLHPIDNRPVLSENSPTENPKPIKKTRFNLDHDSNNKYLIYDSDGGLDLIGFQSPTEKYKDHRKRNLTLDLGKSMVEVAGSYSSVAVAYSNALTNPLNAVVHGSDYGSSQSRSGSQQSPVMVPSNDNKRAQFSRSLSNADVQTDNITDSGSTGKRRGDSSSLTESGSKSSASGINSSASGMGKKSASASQLSATGRKRRLGFGSKGKSSFTVHRSEEVLPGASRSLIKQPSSVSSDGDVSQDGESAGQSTEGEVTTFIGKLGPGQKVSRQILGTPYRGDVKIGFNFFVNFMEVTVFEAKDLINVKETKTKLPDTYVKVYLVKGKKCVEKHRTKTIKESLQPKYMEVLKFKSSPASCLIQVSVWGDYGREKGRKVFMGVAVIYMDSISTSPGSSLTEWYRLFGSSSL
ncbi:regulating synaptic membrane exocytosis protein 2 isoform X1 [Daktulosphaira vitifoliae]|uniref:regulating synaptic membrane exocytosis protein 2 isoform X1 n=1 Tax=Daktulosphaira vitifoliae TaxID=58002 RepID=UPI0021AA1CD2|nr:regulating synaptic membrane exocytosis protein 2 isoform X1 [Daktulosphaira vitifoliae]